MSKPSLGWLGIVRLGLVQTALGAIVVLTTSTLNRVMIVELALPAMLPGALVAWHYAVQMTRPRWGHGSDVGGRRTPWIIGGMIVLAAGGILAATATAIMETRPTNGIALSIFAFALIGIGVGASGTSLLALLATRVTPSRRAAAATIVWMMMIFGFIITATVAGSFLDPYSPTRLVVVTSVVAFVAVIVAVVAVWGVEIQGPAALQYAAPNNARNSVAFKTALAEIWEETEARRFTIFVFVSMLAYSAQDVILEPFSGIVFGFTPGESTKLSGIQHSGVFLGMAVAALAGSKPFGRNLGTLQTWTIGGCIASAIALLALSYSGYYPDVWPLRLNVFLLGVANGAFAVAAIGSMMMLAGHGQKSREGIRMGLWGAAQATAFGIGGLLGAAAIDLFRNTFASPVTAYGLVFAAEAVLFLLSGMLAAWVGSVKSPGRLEQEHARMMPAADPGRG